MILSAPHSLSYSPHHPAPPFQALLLRPSSPTASPTTHIPPPTFRARNCPGMSPLPARHARIRAKHAGFRGFLELSRRRKTQLIALFLRSIVYRTGSCTLVMKSWAVLGGVDPGPWTCDPTDPFLRRRSSRDPGTDRQKCAKNAALLHTFLR